MLTRRFPMSSLAKVAASLALSKSFTPPRLPPPPHEHLSFHNHLPAQPLGDRLGRRRIAGHLAARHRHAVLGKNVFRLVFVKLHRNPKDTAPTLPLSKW